MSKEDPYESVWKSGPKPNEKRAVMTRVGNAVWCDYCEAHGDSPETFARHPNPMKCPKCTDYRRKVVNPMIEGLSHLPLDELIWHALRPYSPTRELATEALKMYRSELTLRSLDFNAPAGVSERASQVLAMF